MQTEIAVKRRFDGCGSLTICGLSAAGIIVIG